MAATGGVVRSVVSFARSSVAGWHRGDYRPLHKFDNPSNGLQNLLKDTSAVYGLNWVSALRGFSLAKISTSAL